MSKVLDEQINRVKTAKYGDYEKRYGVTIGIHNGARTGKTLTAVMLSLYYMLKIKSLKGILSNVFFQNLDELGLDGVYHPLTDIKKISGDEYKDYIIVTDEFRSIIDSRMSGSFKNLFISNILRDTGKFRQIHLLTDQDANAIDRRVRVNTDIVLHPQVNLKSKLCRVKIFEGYDNYYYCRAYGMITEWDIWFEFPIMDYARFYDTEQKIGEYYLTFKPDEYAEQFLTWIRKHEYDKHPDFTIKNATVNLWKETEGIYINDTQKSALLEWLLYNCGYPVYGRREKKPDKKSQSKL